MKKLFSAFAASELLGRDRQTLVRCLRNVPPDGKAGNSPRWAMDTIFAALEKHNRVNESNGGNAYRNGRSHGGITGADPGLVAVYAAFDAKLAVMEAAPTLEKRRALAIKLGPILVDMDRKVREVGVANGQDDELVNLRADRTLLLALRGVEGPTQWSLAECRQHLGAA
jgi:hypothetical protein